MSEWLIGIDHINKCVVIRRSKPGDHNQGNGLTNVRVYYGRKVPKAIREQYQKVADTIFWGQR
jgi:hypothetical protein